jgi:hypothetical protein
VRRHPRGVSLRPAGGHDPAGTSAPTCWNKKLRQGPPQAHLLAARCCSSSSSRDQPVPAILSSGLGCAGDPQPRPAVRGHPTPAARCSRRGPRTARRRARQAEAPPPRKALSIAGRRGRSTASSARPRRGARCRQRTAPRPPHSLRGCGGPKQGWPRRADRADLARTRKLREEPRQQQPVVA